MLSLPAMATEWASEAQEIHFSSTDEVFSTLGFDTGYLPSQASPISVRFHLTPTGGVVTDMDCESRLEWPDPLQHAIVGVPESGWFGVDAEIEIEAEVHIDIFGLWTGSVDLWSEKLEMLSGTPFDPPLLGETREHLDDELVDVAEREALVGDHAPALGGEAVAHEPTRQQQQPAGHQRGPDDPGQARHVLERVEHR